ncbi:ABC transporter substrate-binding protein [Bosea sp. BIWAKO-01]|uniref:ABC transporter substrate-binding protein n=1 Tax=Bosea sp. BIWAKO-01 TaxID=506668 RepID=UPI000853D5B8|nr:ABC transporter substrate-binding protein [Bosea sp. BIWAKO-01]GAU84439.1 oligopeptide ABC transporter periplasmic oligopeptide-binding protein OppA [Bosea sp. BIWAKO-01]
MNRLTALLLGSAAAIAATAGPVSAQQKAPLSILRVIDADNYDPIRSTSTAAAEALYMLADTLVSVDFDMKTIKPGLAESWTVSPDGTTYTFKLRTDVKFCDGRPMTAEDVVYSLKRWTDPANKSPVSFRGGQVKDIRAEGDATVVYELKEPYSDLLFQIGLSFASVVDKNAVEKLGANFGVQGFNATGPYCWVKWTPRQELVMKKNPHYTWGPPIYKDPKPQIDEIVWKIIPESNTLMAAIQAKQADVTYYMPYIALDTMQRMPGMQVQRQDNYIYDIFMGFKVDKPIASEGVIREAVNMAVNKDAIAKAIFFGKGQTLPALLNASVLDFDKDAAAKMPKYDPAAAAKLLDAAGWKAGADGIREKDGKKATFTVYGIRNDVNPRITEAMQADLRKVGVDMKIQLWDATVAWGKLATQEFDAFVMAYPYVTATEALNLYFNSRQAPTPNRMNWKDPKTDEMLKAAATAVDADKRKQAIGAVQTQLTEANVWVPLVSQPLWVVSGDRVEGVRAHGVYGAGLYKGLDIKLKR